jgi:hypothetical protein
MMRLTFADRTFLLGTEAAELVVHYAAALARAHTADTIKVRAYGTDGGNVEALLLLNEGAPIMVETSNSRLPEPDNEQAVEYMRGRMQTVAAPRQALPITPEEAASIAQFEHAFEVDLPGAIT